MNLMKLLFLINCCLIEYYQYLKIIKFLLIINLYQMSFHFNYFISLKNHLKTLSFTITLNLIYFYLFIFLYLPLIIF